MLFYLCHYWLAKYDEATLLQGVVMSGQETASTSAFNARIYWGSITLSDKINRKVPGGKQSSTEAINHCQCAFIADLRQFRSRYVIADKLVL